MTKDQAELINLIGNQLDELYESFTMLEVDVALDGKGGVKSSRNLIEEEFRVRTMAHSPVANSLEEWCDE